QHLYIIDSVHILILHLSPFLSYHFHSTTPQPTQIYTLSLHDALPILDSLCSETIAFICSKAVWSRSTSVSRMPFLCDTQPCTIPTSAPPPNRAPSDATIASLTSPPVSHCRHTPSLPVDMHQDSDARHE